MAMPTLLEVIALNGTDDAVGLIEEASKSVPEVALGAARTIKGLNYKARVRTAVPTVGFRQANQGTAVVKSTYESRLFECFLMNPPFEVDKAVADVYEDGAAAYLAMEALGMTEGAFQALGTAFFYGTHATFGKTDSFPGMLQTYDSTNMVVDAGGTTDDTASSVWGVSWGIQDVKWLLGQGGEVGLSDVTEVRLVDDSSNPYTGYHQELYLRPGLQVGSVYSVGRIKKLTADSGKGLTDAKIFELLSKYPAGKLPDVLYASARSIYQLQASRTATNATGAPAPIPTSIEGIPIVPTESILDTEKLAT